MEKHGVIDAIKKFGKPAYVAKKGLPVIRKWDPIKKEVSYIISDQSNQSLLDEPVSLIGGVSHHLKNEEWPLSNNQPLFPILQITPQNLPIFLELFKPGNKVICVYCPESQEHGDYGVVVKEYPDPSLLQKLHSHQAYEAYQDILEEEEMYLIRWEKVIDYPQHDVFELFYPEHLARVIHDEFDDYYESFPTALGTKIGGYPFCIQHEPDVWDNRPPNQPEDWNFIMQIDSEDFGMIDLGDCGIVNVFQNSKTKEWRGDFQCC
jgi:uncharacterized protein YwqG